MVFPIDLHMHSFESDDGELAPAELIRRCAASGIDCVSVADHNCVRGSAEAQKTACQLGLSYIPGVELDCVYQHRELHLLGYGMDWRHPDFAAREADIRQQCRDASLQMLLLTQQLGFRITRDDMRQLAQKTRHPSCWTGEMFAEFLLHSAENGAHSLLAPYRPGGERSDNPYVNFYWDFYAQGKPCYVPKRYPSLQEAVDLIHRAGGLAVLAHPGASLKGQENLFPAMVTLGLDGVEAISSYHTGAVSAFYWKLAEVHRLMVTCGSDFHGKAKPSVSLGRAAVPAGVAPDAVMEALAKTKARLLAAAAVWQASS